VNAHQIRLATKVLWAVNQPHVSIVQLFCLNLANVVFSILFVILVALLSLKHVALGTHFDHVLRNTSAKLIRNSLYC